MIAATRPSIRLSDGESQWHDVVRLILILQVVLGHMAAIALPSVPELAAGAKADWPFIVFRILWRFGPESAYLFVFLSGFMVAGPLFFTLRRGEVLPTARVFFGKRLRRIVPIALAAIAATAVIDAASRLAPGAGSHYVNSYSYDMVSTFTWPVLLGNLFFLQPVFVPSFGSNGPLWTLGYIVQYYVLGWLILSLWPKRRLLSAICLVASLAIMSSLSIEWAVLFCCWLLGGLVRQYRVSGTARVPLIVIAILLFIGSSALSPIERALISAPVGILATLALTSARPIERIRQSSFLRRASNDTYSIYAIHHPILMSVFIVVFGGVVGPSGRFAFYGIISGLGVLFGSALLTFFVNLTDIQRLATGLRGPAR